MSLGVPLSQRRVSGFNDAERLLLWALRHRVAEGDPQSPHLVSAFGFMCGPTAGAVARRALDRLVRGFQTFARRPLAFLDWCNPSVSEDEAAVLALCAELQAGRLDAARLEALVVPAGAEPVGDAARALLEHFAAAGLHLPPAAPAAPPGGLDVTEAPSVRR